MQVVINTKVGGYFALSKDAIEYIQKKIKDKDQKKSVGSYAFEQDRSNSILIEVVKKLKDKANGKNTILKIVEIPDDIEWQIFAINGEEWIAEKHRTWR